MYETLNSVRIVSVLGLHIRFILFNLSLNETSFSETNKVKLWNQNAKIRVTFSEASEAAGLKPRTLFFGHGEQNISSKNGKSDLLRIILLLELNFYARNGGILSCSRHPCILGWCVCTFVRLFLFCTVFGLYIDTSKNVIKVLKKKQWRPCLSWITLVTT